MFIGLAICSDALDVTPSRHWPALMISLVLCFCNWAKPIIQGYAANICSYTDSAGNRSNCLIDPRDTSVTPWTLDPTGDLRGLFAISEGYMVTEIILASMLVKLIDHDFLSASLWAGFAALCACFGLIHSSELHVPWNTPEVPESAVASQYNLYWDFTISYAMLGASFIGLYALKLSKLLPEAPQKLADAERLADAEKRALVAPDGTA